jgi:hypothetical protein
MYGGGGDGGPAIEARVARALGAVALDVGFLSGDRLLYGRGGILLGWSVREAGGTPALAQFELRDGGNSAGTMLAAISMAASGDSQLWMGLPGVQFQSSMFGHVVSGASVGALWIIPDA